MALFRDKKGEINIDAIMWLLGGIWLLSQGLGPHPGTYISIGLAAVAVSIGKALNQRWSAWAALVLMSGALVLAVHAVYTSGLATKHLVISAIMVWGVWQTWHDDIRGESSDDDDEAAPNKPLVSLVLLLSKPRYLESRIIAHILESAWGGDYTSGDGEGQDGFAAGDGALYIIKSPMGMFMLHNLPTTYWTDVEKVVEALPELRMRKVVHDHQAWLSVDLIADDNDDPGHSAAYAAIIRLLHELADESVLGILRPETGHIKEWSDDVLDTLLRPHGEERFHQAGQAPVLQVASDDPSMIAVVAEARRRWPEFVSAFEQRKPGDVFSIKAPVTVDGVTEHIWIAVHALEPEFIHGELGNDPVDLGALKLGSPVKVPVSDLDDWGYSHGEGMLTGLFTVHAMRKK